MTGLRYYNGSGISRPNVEMNCNDIFMRHFWSTWNAKVIAQSPAITAPQREEMADCWGPMLRKQGKSEGFDSCDRPSNLKLDSNRQFFRPCDREILWMTSKNNRALLLYYIKLCASFQIHWWIQTGFTVQKRSIRVEIGDMLSRVTLKFDGWPWKTIGHLFYAT